MKIMAAEDDCPLSDAESFLSQRGSDCGIANMNV